MEPTEEEILKIAHYLTIGSTDDGWYMSSDDHDRERYFYLHKDGKVRNTATFGGEHTGYWATEAEARAFHEDWKQSFTTKHDEEKQERINAFKERVGNKISMRDIIGKLKENGYN